MADDRLKTKDLKVLLLWIVVAVVGAVFAFKYFFIAFPEASVDFRISRPAAVEAARKFLMAQGQKLDGYQSSIVFRVDEDAKTYLERELGLKQANQLMSSDVSVWYWDVRFFRPRQQEEFHVRLSPAGRVIGCDHVIEEARAGARLDHDAAHAAAESYLRAHYAEQFGAYDFLPEEANSTERPRRRDWSFTWERRGFKAKEAPYRLKVLVQGDSVGGSEEFLKVPEAWKRDFERLRSSNTLYGTIALIPYALLNGAVLWVLFDLGRRGLIRWKGALKLGLILALLFFVTNANEWPLARADYDTNSSYAGFFVGRMLIALFSGLALGLVVSLTVAAAEPLYRRSQPDKLRLSVAFSLPGLRSKEFFRSCVIGLCFAAAHIGFVVLFYLLGSKIGFWAPQDINYADVVSTALPWVYPLTIGAYAATSEEFLFRLFAIPFLLRFTGSRFLAVVIPAFAWGFLHSSYPQEPGYVRGIEVGLIGIVAGLVMLRWGILATLIWHYTVDALLISLILLRSDSLYFRASGAIVGAAAFIPLAIAGAFYFSRGRFETEEPLVNRAEPVPEIALERRAVAEARQGPYEALSPHMLRAMVACGVLGAILLAAVKANTIGDFVRVSINARRAATKADEVLRQRQVNPATFRKATTFVSNFDAYVNEYLRRQVGIFGANRLYQEKVPSAFWRVRYFRDGQKEEYAVILRTDGTLHSVHHDLEERAPGVKLSKEEAQGRAEEYLRNEKKLDLSKWKLVEAKSENRPGRTDHTFTREELESAGGEAHVRIETKVQGDEVSGYRVFVKIPEEWERRQKERTLASIVQRIGRIAFFAALGITALVIFFKNLKQQHVPWRRLALWALAGLLATAVATASALPTLLARYPTEYPFKTYAAILAISMFFIVGFTYSALFFLFGLAWFFLSRSFGSTRLPAWSGMPATYYRDAFWIALAGTGALLGLGRLSYVLTRIWPTARKMIEANVPSGLDAYLPAAQAIGGAITSGLFTLGLIALAAGFVAGYVRQRWWQFVLVFLLALTRVQDWGSPADFVRKLLVQLIAVTVVWWGVTRVVRFNLLAYFSLAVTMALSGAALQLLEQPNAFFRANGYAVIAALLALLAWSLIGWLRDASSHGLVPDDSGPIV